MQAAAVSMVNSDVKGMQGCSGKSGALGVRALGCADLPMFGIVTPRFHRACESITNFPKPSRNLLLSANLDGCKPSLAPPPNGELHTQLHIQAVTLYENLLFLTSSLTLRPQ